MNNRLMVKLPLYIGMGVLTLSLLFAAFSVSQKASPTRMESSANVSRATLSLNPTEGNFKIGDSIDMAVTLTSGSPAGGADIIIKYDKNKISIDGTSVIAGNLFNMAKSEISSGDGLLTTTLIAKNTAGEKNAILETFKLKVTGTGASNIHILENSRVVEAGSLADIPKQVKDALFNFNR